MKENPHCQTTVARHRIRRLIDQLGSHVRETERDGWLNLWLRSQSTLKLLTCVPYAVQRFPWASRLPAFEEEDDSFVSKSQTATWRCQRSSLFPFQHHLQLIFHCMTLLTKPWNNLFWWFHCTLVPFFSTSLSLHTADLCRASTLLCPVAEQHFPYMTKEIPVQITYIKNLLRSTSYLLHQRSRFLEIILSKLLRLDVRTAHSLLSPILFVRSFVQVHASRQDIMREETSSIENELVFSLEQLDTNDTNTSSMKHDQADKLDCLMFVMFEYINSVGRENGEREKETKTNSTPSRCLGTVNYERSKVLFRDLLTIFNKILLPTHDSSHVQFLLFHICSFHTVNEVLLPEAPISFLSLCLGLQWWVHEQLLENIRLAIGIDDLSPSIDLLSLQFDRSSQVYQHEVNTHPSMLEPVQTFDLRSVLSITQLMVDWLHAYVSNMETTSGNANPNRHLPFYAICQAVLYIFVYRHQEIARLHDGKHYNFHWLSLIHPLEGL